MVFFWFFVEFSFSWQLCAMWRSTEIRASIPCEERKNSHIIKGWRKGWDRKNMCWCHLYIHCTCRSTLFSPWPCRKGMQHNEMCNGIPDERGGMEISLGRTIFLFTSVASFRTCTDNWLCSLSIFFEAINANPSLSMLRRWGGNSECKFWPND